MKRFVALIFGTIISLAFVGSALAQTPTPPAGQQAVPPVLITIGAGARGGVVTVLVNGVVCGTAPATGGQVLLTSPSCLVPGGTISFQAPAGFQIVGPAGTALTFTVPQRGAPPASFTVPASAFRAIVATPIVTATPPRPATVASPVATAAPQTAAPAAPAPAAPRPVVAAPAPAAGAQAPAPARAGTGGYKDTAENATVGLFVLLAGSAAAGALAAAWRARKAAEQGRRAAT